LKLACVLFTAAILMSPANAAAQDTKVDFDKGFDFSTAPG
jgi:hypothetical protein